MTDAMQKWEREEGIKFLKKIGIKAGQTVLDFGARVGHYSIPAAMAVGKAGLIYAVDKEHKDLDELNRKAQQLKLKNLKIIPTTGTLSLDFRDKSIDVVLLYDMLHYLKIDERKKLYAEVFRILKPAGILSVYPKHVIEDHPLQELAQRHLADVMQEIWQANFKFLAKYCDIISHDDTLNQGCVFNFVKNVMLVA